MPPSTSPTDVGRSAAVGDERDRLWARWQRLDHDLDALTARRSRPTQIVLFEPRDPPGR